MTKILYGVLCYLVFLASFLYAIAFVTGIGAPRTVDHGISAPPGQALAVNLALFAAFAGAQCDGAAMLVSFPGHRS